MQITEEEYLAACDSNQGWCTFCKAFCGDFAEPDACGYTCPECGHSTVYSAEEALLNGMISF
jgi:hypothetical protein